MTRREREKESRRREILAAAHQVFSERGYAGATLDEVARVAEYAKGTLYSYFPSKSELFAALVEREFDLLVADMREAVAANADPAAAVRAAILVMLEYVDVHADFLRIAISHQDPCGRPDAAKIRDIIAARIGEVVDVVGRRMAEGIAAGYFKNYDPAMVGYLLLGFVRNFSEYKFRLEERPAFGEEAADAIMDIFLDGFRRRTPVVPEDR